MQNVQNVQKTANKRRIHAKFTVHSEFAPSLLFHFTKTFQILVSGRLVKRLRLLVSEILAEPCLSVRELGILSGANSPEGGCFELTSSFVLGILTIKVAALNFLQESVVSREISLKRCSHQGGRVRYAEWENQIVGTNKQELKSLPEHLLHFFQRKNSMSLELFNVLNPCFFARDLRKCVCDFWKRFDVANALHKFVVIFDWIEEDAVDDRSIIFANSNHRNSLRRVAPPRDLQCQIPFFIREAWKSSIDRQIFCG